MLFVNFKTYEEATGERAVDLTRVLEDVAIENIAIGTKVRSRLNGHHGEVFKVYNGREDFDIFIKWDNGKESVCWHFQGGNIEVLSE